MEVTRIIPLLLLVFCGISVAFDLFAEDNLIPSDGFHDLLGLTPFWVTQHMHSDLRRSLGTKRDNLPSTLDDFLSTSSGSAVYQMAGSCDLTGTFSGEKAELEVKKVGECAKPSLTVIFQKLFPTIDLSEATQRFILPDQFELDKLEIVKSSKEVTIEASAKDTLAYVERKILVGEGKLTLGFTASAANLVGIKYWQIKIEGVVGISSHRVKMILDKPKGEENLPFTWEIDMVLMVDLMGIFGITASAMNFNDVGFDSTQLEGITFTGATIKGQLGIDETFQIVAKASVAFSKATQQADVFLILTRPAGASTKPAIIIDVKDTINIKDALEVFITQKDFISDFGMIGRIERDCIIMLAKDDIVMVQNQDLMTLVSKFITEYDTKQIPKGVNVRVLVPMKDNMQKECSADAKFAEDVPDILPITIKITAGGLAFKYPEKFKSDLPSMLKCLDKQIASELPSQLFPRPDGLINIKEFTAAAGKYMKLTIVLQGPFEFLGGKIKLADIELSVSKKTGENWKFEGVTTITVGPLSVGITIAKDGGTYSFSAYVESFKLDQLEEMIGKTTLTDFVGLLGSLKDFGIKDFKLIKEFGDTSSLRVSGVPILWGWDKCSIEGLVWKPDKSKSKNSGQPTTAVAVGVVIEAVRLDKLMEKIVGNKLFSVAWFSEMTAVCIVSNADGKVESSNDAEAKPNEIGNKDKEIKPKPAEEKSSARSRAAAVDDSNREPIKEFEAFAKPIAKMAHKKKNVKRNSIVKVLRRSVVRGGPKLVRPPYARAAATKANKQFYRKPQPQTQVGSALIDAARRVTDSSRLQGAKRDGDDDDDDEDPIKFNIPYLTSQDIAKGLTFIGIFNIPQDNGCKGDSMCLWLGEKVGRDATIEVMGAIGPDGFKFSAKFSGTIILIPDKLTLQEIELSLELSGKKSSVKLSCTLYWADRDILGDDQIQFQGAIEVSLTGKLNLEFNMMGMWTQPFGFEYLAFGNLHLAIGIAVGLPVPSFEFGAEVWVGKIKKGMKNNDHAIKIAGYFGVDVNRPRDNYVYASVNAFTIAKVFEAFELGAPNLPKFLADTGFPEGIVVAYSTTGKDIEAHDISIAAGLYLKGTINFLGYSVAGEIAINPGEKILVDINMSPIDWAGGLIALRRSETDKVNGPKAFIYLTTDSITVQIKGYISLLGVSHLVDIDVSDTGYEFRIETKIWDMIHTKLHVSAAYGSLAALSFEFTASVSINLHLREIFNAVKEFMKKCADAATDAINAAQEKLAEAKAALKNADTKMTGWQSSMSAYQNKLRERSAEIERKKQEFVASCKSKCGKVCVPFLDWKSRCFKIWWWWVGCPTWNHCRWKVDNLICIAGCEITKLANKFVAWAEQTGIKIMIGLTEIGKGLVEVGKGFVGMANKLVDFGNNLLEFAKNAVAAGKKIAEAVTDWLAENLFEIRLLELSGKLDNEFNACVGLKIDCSILGVTIDYEGKICINLNFWKNLAADTVEQQYTGVKQMDSEVQKVQGEIEEFDKDKADLAKKEEKIESDVKQETSQKRKRDYVPTAEEDYFRRLAEEPLPTIVTRSAETVNAFKTSAPWVLIKDYDIRNFDHTPHQDLNIPAEKRTLDEDWEKHASNPCMQIHKVIDKYSMIADGLSTLSQSLRNVRGNYQATKRSMQQGVDALEGQVHDAESSHNMTYEERSDLHHWYKEAKHGLEQWETKASKLVDEQHDLSMPVFRSQIEHILMKEKKTNFVGYMNELHKVGTSAYKRSSIPNESIIAATQELHGIKKDLINLVNDDQTDSLKLMTKVRSVRSNIQGLRRSMERCQ